MSSVFSKKISKLSDLQEPLSSSSDSDIIELNCEDIICLEQVRTEQNPGFSEDGLLDLANSMKNDGQIEPVIVRKNPDSENSYIMVAGERRYRAAQLLNLSLKAIVLDITEETARRIQIAENIHRENLSQKEIAKAVVEDKEKFSTLEAVAKEYNKSINWVSQMIKFHETVNNPESFAAQLVVKNITSDITAINDMEKLSKISLKDAVKTLDELEINSDSSVRKVIKKKLKDVKEDKKIKVKNRKEVNNNENDIECTSFDELINLVNSSHTINFIKVYGIVKKQKEKQLMQKISTFVQDTEEIKSVKEIFLEKEIFFSDILTRLVVDLNKEKFGENFSISLDID